MTVNKYGKHPSILKLKEFVGARELFSLPPIDEDIIIKKIYSLDEAASNTRKTMTSSPRKSILTLIHP